MADAELTEYRRRPDTAVVAIPLELVSTEGDATGAPLFEYFKWGSTQSCKSGDWLVHNGDDIYTVDRESFVATYERVEPGRYQKTAHVWAKRAQVAGSIKTREGETHYAAGDYIVYNAPPDATGEVGDGYAVTAAKFESLYEPVSG